MTTAARDASRRAAPARPLAGLALLIGAAFTLVVLIHVLLSRQDGAGPALVIAVGWIGFAAVAAGAGAGRPVAGMLLAAAIAAAAWWQQAWLLARVDLIYLFQHAGSHALLGAWFGASLWAAATGRGEALVTRLARRVHGALPPAIERYTVAVTAGWTAYFVLMAIASCLLYGYGSREAWSTLANLVTLPLVVLLFIVEYRVRLALHPDFEHASIVDGIREFWR